MADDPKMVHSLAASKLQSNLEYKRESKEERARFKMGADQPEFQQAKKSQAQASDLTYRQRLHDYTCDPQQLNLQHAKQAYKLQSDVSTAVFLYGGEGGSGVVFQLLFIDWRFLPFNVCKASKGPRPT